MFVPFVKNKTQKQLWTRQGIWTNCKSFVSQDCEKGVACPLLQESSSLVLNWCEEDEMEDHAPPHHLIYWKRLEKNLFTRHCQKKKKKKCDSAYHTPETCWYRNKKVVPCLCIGDTVISFSIKMPWLASERMPTNRKTELKVCLLLFKVSVKFKRSRGTRFPGLHAGRMHDTWCEISGPLNIRIVWWLFCVTVKYWNTFVCFVTVHICGPKPWMPWSRQALQQGPEHGPKQRLLFREAANASAEDPSTPADEHV